MGAVKRSVLYLIRNPWKGFTLCSMTFILGILSVGAVSIQRAVESTEQNLHRTLPPLVTIGFDGNAHISLFGNPLTGEEGSHHGSVNYNELQLTHEKVYKIASHPSVVGYDFSLNTVLYSSELRRFSLYGTYDGLRTSFMTEPYSDYSRISIKGISTPEFLDLNSGKIEIVDGRGFREEEMSIIKEVHPILMSAFNANIHHLEVGSIFTMANIFLSMNPDIPFVERFQEENRVLWNEYTFKVIGLFDVPRMREEELRFGVEGHGREMELLGELLNRIYIPSYLANNFHRQALDIQVQELYRYWSVIPMKTERVSWDNIIFVLSHPKYLLEFQSFAREILPPVYDMVDLSFAYSHLVGMVESASGQLTLFFTVAIGAVAVVMFLIVLIYLKDRKKEYAIYLALGCKRSLLYIQTLFELLLPSIIALVLAIAVGDYSMARVSSAMVMQEYIHQKNELEINPNFITISQRETQNTTHLVTFYTQHVGESLMWFVPPAKLDDLTAAFDLSLTTNEVINFFIMNITGIFLAASVSMVYISIVNPKKLLADGRNG
ncbi:MAG: ABC transporter permease [Turicibacter sp.]|nr:ABC transporter permease [Turicibacter sp.]